MKRLVISSFAVAAIALVLAAVAACSTNCYWMLTGNPGTDGGVVNYLGTTDKQPLNLRVGTDPNAYGKAKTGDERLQLPPA